MIPPISLELHASILRRGRLVDHCSSAVTLIALLAGLSPLFGADTPSWTLPLWIVLCLIGLAEKYWAARVMLDAELFSWLSRIGDPRKDPAHDLDEALASLFNKPQSSIARDWNDRGRGAVSLLRRQLLCLIAQCLIILILMICLSWWTLTT